MAKEKTAEMRSDARKDSGIEQDPAKAKVEEIKAVLSDFSKKHQLRDLGDRVRRGLDPIGIVAWPNTAEKAKALSEQMGVPYEKVLAMCVDIQQNGPWEYAHHFKDGDDAVSNVWLMLNAANTIGKEREMDLTADEFVADLERVHGNLDSAIADPKIFYEQAKPHVIDRVMQNLRVEDGVPVAELDNGFIPVALLGYEAGVLQDADGMLFVGAKKIPEEVFAEWGLRPEVREDRGRMCTFYMNTEGDALFKMLYPGFAVVISRNFDLAKDIARVSMGQKLETKAEYGHIKYRPTSAKDERERKRDENDPMYFLRPRNTPFVPGEPSKSTELLRVKDQFYFEMARVKSQVVFLEAAEAMRKERAAKKKPVKDEDLNKLILKTEKKMEQKMDELKFMIEAIAPFLDKLPAKVDTVLDMAGGAGDLGLAVASHMLAESKSVRDVRIVDPFSKSLALDLFGDMMVDRLPFRDELRTSVRHTNEALQEAEIPSNAIVVAKHACGDLTDMIISKWVASESPVLAVMTCCQEKAAKNPAGYNLEQKKWESLCKESALTNQQDAKKREKGMAAMTELDQARIAYLKRFKIDAKLIQTDKFPKGDVIVAVRSPKRR